MSLLFKLKMAKQAGEKRATQEGFTALPVDPFKIAEAHGITVSAKPAEVEGVSGMLLRHGNAFGIFYATNIASEGFQRFSIGHELAHYFLEGHPEYVHRDGHVHISRAGFVSADPFEMEADQFAAGLLMPERLFKPLLARRDPGLATVEEAARACRTSLTATAIRCAEMSKDAIAAIISTGQVVDYCFMSGGMKSLLDLNFIRKGSRVPAGTTTAALNANTGRVRAGARATDEIDSMDWFGGTRSVKLTEEVLGLGSYGKTITILSSASLALAEEGFDDDEADERDLIESYTPRFRR